MAYDLVGNIMAYEDGQLDEPGTATLFKHLVDSGYIYSLQGSYQREAARRKLIEPFHLEN